MESLRRIAFLDRAFTLIEMLVCIAILTIIAAVVFSSHASFSNSLIISNTAYDVALSLRNAESYGAASRGYGSVANAGYGLYFSTVSPTTYAFFADIYPSSCSSGSSPTCKPGDGLYEAGQDGLVTTYHLGDGVTITNFCGTSSGVSKCVSGVSTLAVVFTRPNDTPSIIGVFGGVQSTLSSACVTLQAAQGTRRYISITQNGLISATAVSCP